MKKIISLVLIFAVLVDALFLLGGGAEIDETFTISQHLGVFLMFFVWILSIQGWASLIRRKLKIEKLGWITSFALSLVLYSFSVALLGSLGLIGYSTNLYFLAAVVLGLILFVAFLDFGESLSRLRAYYGRAHASRLSWLVLTVLILIVFKRVYLTQTPWGFTDPLIYQLLAPRYWTEHGVIYFPGNAPLCMMASYWEYLHVWAFKLISSGPGKGLIEIQLFAQLTHILGYLLCGAAVERICRVQLKCRPETTLISIFSVLSLQALLPYSDLAKNDWGTAFFILLGMSLLELQKNPKPERNPSEFVPDWRGFAIGGLLLGFGVGAKYIHLPFAAILICFRIFISTWEKKKIDFRSALLLGIPFCLAAAPFFLRNYILTGDPLYPYYFQLFGTKTPMNPGLIELIDGYQYSAGSNGIWIYFQNLWMIITSDFSSCAVPFVLFSCLIYWKKRPPFLIPIFAALLAVSFFLLLHTSTELRHIGSPLIVFCVLTPIAIEHYFGLFKINRFRNVALALYFCGVFFFSPNLIHFDSGAEGGSIDFLKYVLEEPPANIFIVKTHYGGLMKAWLRANAPEDTNVVVTRDMTFYYMPRMRVDSFELSSDFLKIKNRPESTEAFFRELASAGYSFLGDDMMLETRSSLSVVISPYLKEHPCLVAFQTKDSRVIDLQKVLSLPGGRCPSHAQ